MADACEITSVMLAPVLLILNVFCHIGVIFELDDLLSGCYYITWKNKRKDVWKTIVIDK